MFWGVSRQACNDLVRNAERSDTAILDLETNWNAFADAQFAQRSNATVPAGLGQAVSIDADLGAMKQSGYDLATAALKDCAAESRIAFVICAGLATRPHVSQANAQLTFVRLRREDASASLQPEVVRQVVSSKGAVHQILGIYGFEDGDRETECMVCYDRPRSVVVLPCRHCFVCPPCLRSLREERCPMCRSTFSAYLLLPLLREHEQSSSAGARTGALE